ncbi:hypothetical protein VCHC80A1_03173, partial [Vibrio cholerae HC-80A1]
SAQT